MARTQTRILTSIWSDEAFTALTQDEQRLYLLLISQPGLTHGGLLPITLRRWAAKANGSNEYALRLSLDVLSERGFVVADHIEDELFVSGYFQHAGIGGQPRVVAAAYDAIIASPSFMLRGIASVELSNVVAKAPAVAAPTGLRAQVLRRDGWQCRGCGWSPGDYIPAAPTGRPLYRGLEIDHIHPRSRGGGDELDNLQVLCTSCNARKGAQV